MQIYRTLSPRFWALIIDGLIFFFISYLFQSVYLVPEMPVPIIIFGELILWLSYLIYSIYLHMVYGQTLGKMALKIRVLDISENALTLSQAIWREVSNIVFFVLFFGSEIYQLLTVGFTESYGQTDFNLLLVILMHAWYLAEWITALCNQKRRSLHDYIAGTVVVRLNR